eukprot:scaffold355033_cov54-Attheya_sp.AAC.1
MPRAAMAFAILICMLIRTCNAFVTYQRQPVTKIYIPAKDESLSIVKGWNRNSDGDDMNHFLDNLWMCFKSDTTTKHMTAFLAASVILMTPLTIDVRLDSTQSDIDPWGLSNPHVISIVPSRALALSEEQLLVEDVWRE